MKKNENMEEAYLKFIPILAPTFPLSRLHSTDMEFLHHALGATVSHTSVFLHLRRRTVMNLFDIQAKTEDGKGGYTFQ